MVKYDYSFQLGANQGDSRKASNWYVTMHDTGNANNVGVNSAKNEASYMKGHWQSAYTHAIAGWDRVYIVGEPGYIAYGAGSPANERSPFQIELARYSNHTKALQAYANWINAAHEQAKKYGIPLVLDGSGKGVKSHKWVSDNLWGDHQDPYAYLTSIGISKAQFAADIKNGVGSKVTATAPAKQPAKKAATKPVAKASVKAVNVTYGLHQIGGGWLGDVTNFNSTDNGYAGNPNHKHDFLFVKVSHGSVRYQVHTAKSGWLGWVTKGDKKDTVNGCAGISGEPIDKVQIEFLTPKGEPYQQAWYRSQTTQRAEWLGTVCDLGKSIGGYTDTFAGESGEPLDRLQIKIGTKKPF